MPGGGKKAVFPTLALHDHEQVRVVAREQGRAKRFHQSRGKSSEGGKDSPDKETPKPKNKTPPKTVDPSKTKWKSFRNSFEKETNSNPIDHSEDSACGHQPKWDYFTSPLMMRETLSSRMEESLEIETVVPEVDDKVNEEISAVSIESIFEDEGDDIQLIDAVSENTNLDSQESGITSLSIDLNTDHSNFDNDRDPYSYDNKNMQVTQEEEDDDLHFFKSLLPFMKKVSPIRKLIIRSQFQYILAREIRYAETH